MIKFKSNKSAAHILKASAIMGSSSVVTIMAGIVKNKVIALLMGPTGIGLFGLLLAVLTTTSTIAGMGLSNSGIRQIAAVNAGEDCERLAIMRKALWSASFLLGFLGALVLVLFREPVSRLAVGKEGYGMTIAWLGLGVWAITVSGAQTAILNGLRRIGDLARINVIGALVGLPVSCLAVWLWGENGVVVAVVSGTFTTLGASWWFYRKIPSMPVSASWRELLPHQKQLFSLGAVFMFSTLMTVSVQFLVRIILTRTMGMEATGHFQAAWSISMLYLGFVLGAMGTDYYPRLSAVAQDHQATNAMVNEQTEVALLLTGPVILAMLTFSPQIVSLLYSSSFKETTSILRWQILGDLFKVASWPMGFIMLAQGRSRMFFLAELSWNLSYLGLIFFGLRFWGLESTGIAFLLAYILLFGVNWLLVRRITRFAITRHNWLLILLLVVSASVVFFARLSGGVASLLLGVTITLAVGSYAAFRIFYSLGGFPWRKSAQPINTPVE